MFKNITIISAGFIAALLLSGCDFKVSINSSSATNGIAPPVINSMRYDNVKIEGMPVMFGPAIITDQEGHCYLFISAPHGVAVTLMPDSLTNNLNYVK